MTCRGGGVLPARPAPEVPELCGQALLHVTHVVGGWVRLDALLLVVTILRGGILWVTVACTVRVTCEL